MKPELRLDTAIFPPFNGFPLEGIRFLKQLKKHNTRPWFAKHRTEYEEFVKLPMQALVASMKPHFDRFAPEIEANPRRSIFRIYRDTRFSKNKNPYKTHVAAVFHPQGHWQKSAGFYLHIEPGEVFLGGGIYMPDTDQLRKIRTAIVESPKKFLRIVGEKKFVKRFRSLEGEKLQRIPHGFPSDHLMGDWLKYKQFLASVSWEESECRLPNFVKKIVGVYKDLLPLIRFLNAALGS